jgi:hypothetical protein
VALFLPAQTFCFWLFRFRFVSNAIESNPTQRNRQEKNTDASCVSGRNAVTTAMSWRLVDAEFYGDEHCTERMTDFNPIASNAQLNNPVGFAFDNFNRTYWEAKCDEFTGCERHEAWMGIQRNINRETALKAKTNNPSKKLALYQK